MLHSFQKPNKMISVIAQLLAKAGSTIASLMVAYAMFQKFLPGTFSNPLARYVHKLAGFFYPYITITFSEYQGEGFGRSKAYMAVQRYLNANSTEQAQRLQATVVNDCKTIVLSMDYNEEVVDHFEGMKLWWTSWEISPTGQTISWGQKEDKKRYFILTFHKKYREKITKNYLKHVLEEGKDIMSKEGERKLYTNNKANSNSRNMWTHVLFNHPATFDTLAMDPIKKKEIMDDLVTFTKAKDYYAKIGKAWKRGYLLYGPPGTGKSTMIASISNLLDYDIYDLELTSVKDNTELRKLLIETSSKAIIVIEDIDCSLDLTGQRKKKKKEIEDDEDSKEADETESLIKEKSAKDEKYSSQVTLSGLLNFIDGLWSACTDEKIIIFTTNYVEKLDPALVRSGRMDKHIELSYCGFEAFKVLAKNYLGIDEHEMFFEVGKLLEETKMTPADVAENLMPKAFGEDEESGLRRLIKAIEKAKEDARTMADEREKLKNKECDEKKAKKKGANKVKEDGVKENGVATY